MTFETKSKQVETNASRSQSEADASHKQAETGASRRESETGASRRQSETGASRRQSEAGASRRQPIDTRHRQLVNILKKTEQPLSGSFLASELGVSRQIIVQDINQVREKGICILSTPKGYILDRTADVSRVFKVYHKIEDTEAELNLIVDLGAEVKDVFIYHKVYGKIDANLAISSRLDASKFCDDIRTGKSSPLMTVTSGYHYHTVTAKDIETLDLVEDALYDKGYIAPLTDFEPTELTESILRKVEAN